ncbi:MAG TPA: hypothetical protein VFH43_02515, partial [Candidatus Kapabacteria bacterium]|nr:hypothetical protein [Candidatus Kapabacteria bacterium]
MVTTTRRKSVFQRILQIIIILLLSVVFIGLLAFLFSQTTFFRRMIVNELVTTVERSTNGTLEIEELSGDLLNGFVLHNVHLKLKTKTAYDSIDVLFAERVFVRYNVFKLIKATELGARSIIIQHPTINLLKFEGDSIYNHQRLFKPDQPNQPDPQPFTQIVRLEALRIIDGNIRVRDYNKRGEQIAYVKGGAGAEVKERDIDWGDLLIEDLDLDGHLFARGDQA